MVGIKQYINPWQVVRHFARQRHLLWQLTWRHVELRYHGSWLGPLWSLLSPLLMLCVYTFIFSVVFQMRWSDGAQESRLDFALALFCSLATFGVFSESITAAPTLILGNPNYVKRVVFPLEVLPLSKLLANLVQAGFSYAILLVAFVCIKGYLPWTIVFLPLVLLPLALLTLGFTYFLSSLGVFIRDINQVVALAITMIMFLSAVFYPISSLPPRWRPILSMNPLVPLIEDARRTMLYSLPPNWTMWFAVTFVSSLICLAGLAWFMKSKRAFADVI
jgi:lipopolysaccharide transport system permease protein